MGIFHDFMLKFESVFTLPAFGKFVSGIDFGFDNRHLKLFWQVTPLKLQERYLLFEEDFRQCTERTELTPPDPLG